MTRRPAPLVTARELPWFLRAVERLVAMSGVLAAVCLLALLLLMLGELGSRNLFGRSLHVSWEISAYGMAAIVFMAAGSALQYGVHVRVTILSEWLGPHGSRVLDGLVSALGLAVAGLLAVVMTRLAWGSYAGGVMSWSGFGIPLYLPQALAAFGANVFALQLVARLVRIFMNLAPDAHASTEQLGLEGQAE
ncbi:TRAP transporter small permease [Geminicoccaceae bacterium 1502E]|nr:TRAP transporter small permease [Geminicoccaceae bacterium 1502E]